MTVDWRIVTESDKIFDLVYELKYYYILYFDMQYLIRQ